MAGETLNCRALGCPYLLDNDSVIGQILSLPTTNNKKVAASHELDGDEVQAACEDGPKVYTRHRFFVVGAEVTVFECQSPIAKHLIGGPRTKVLIN